MSSKAGHDPTVLGGCFVFGGFGGFEIGILAVSGLLVTANDSLSPPVVPHGY